MLTAVGGVSRLRDTLILASPLLFYWWALTFSAIVSGLALEALNVVGASEAGDFSAGFLVAALTVGSIIVGVVLVREYNDEVLGSASLHGGRGDPDRSSSPHPHPGALEGLDRMVDIRVGPGSLG